MSCCACFKFLCWPCLNNLILGNICPFFTCVRCTDFQMVVCKVIVDVSATCLKSGNIWIHFYNSPFSAMVPSILCMLLNMGWRDEMGKRKARNWAFLHEGQFNLCMYISVLACTTGEIKCTKVIHSHCHPIQSCKQELLHCELKYLYHERCKICSKLICEVLHTNFLNLISNLFNCFSVN